MPALQELNLDNNQIIELSESILNLSIRCIVNAENNRFSLAFVTRLQNQLQQIRDRSHNELGPHINVSIADFTGAPLEVSLEDQLHAWAEEYQAQFHQDLAPLIPFGDSNQKSTFSQYLGRLREIPDYLDGGLPKENVLRRVGDMLNLAALNPEFRSQMIAIISQALSSCGDRVLLAFNDIEILCQCYRENLTEEQVRQLAISQGRYELIKKFAMEQAQQLGLHDEIETILDYHLQLQGSLGLFISTKKMLYSRCSGVTPEMHEEMYARILSISADSLLAASPIWQNWQQKRHQQRIEQISEHYVDLLEQAEALYNRPPSERSNALNQNAELASILRPLFTGDASRNNYDEAARFIADARELAIATLK